MMRGTIIHIVLGLIFSFIWPPSAIAAIFYAKEFGELKKEISGSIWTWSKIKNMVLASFRPVIAMQWVLPGVFAFLLQHLI